MSGLLLLLTVAFLIAAGNFYWTALEQVRPWFPPEFRDEYRVRIALDILIWERSFPAGARRKYLLSTGFGVAAMLCAAILLYLHGQVIGSAGFACVFAYGVGYLLMRWAKYKDRL